jgi:hypothetical protein
MGLLAGGARWTASNTRFEGGMGIDATGPFGLRKRFPAPGLSGRQGEAGGFLQQGGHRERQVAHARLGAFAGAEREVISVAIG